MQREWRTSAVILLLFLWRASYWPVPRTPTQTGQRTPVFKSFNVFLRSPPLCWEKREGKSSLCDGLWIHFLSHSTQSDFIVPSSCLSPLLSQQGQPHYCVSLSHCIYIIVVLISGRLLYAHRHSWPLPAPSAENHFTIIDSHTYSIRTYIALMCFYMSHTNTHTHILAVRNQGFQEPRQTSLCLRYTHSLTHTCSL